LSRDGSFARESGLTEQACINEIIRAEIVREIEEAVSQLPPQCRKIITMSYMEGMTNREIAQEMGLSLQTVKNQKNRALGLLKKRLPNDQFELLLLLPLVSLLEILPNH